MVTFKGFLSGNGYRSLIVRRMNDHISVTYCSNPFHLPNKVGKVFFLSY